MLRWIIALSIVLAAGRSRPRSLRNAASVSSRAEVPSMIAAGSPGSTSRIRKIAAETTRSVTARDDRRKNRKRSKGGFQGEEARRAPPGCEALTRSSRHP